MHLLSPPKAPQFKPKIKIGKKYLIGLAVFLVLAGAIAAVGTGGYFVKKYLDSKSGTAKLSDGTPAAEDTKQLVEKLSAIVVLPQGEEPTVATITDVEKLRADQPFFQAAKNGDKLLIYASAKKAYLYDPVAGKLIDIAPLNVDQGQTAGAQTQSGASPTPSPKPSP